MNYKTKIITLFTIAALYLAGCGRKTEITPEHVRFKEENTQYDFYPCKTQDTSKSILYVRNITPGRSVTFIDAKKDSAFNRSDDMIIETIDGNVNKYVPGESYTDPDGKVFKLSGNSLERVVAEEKLKKIPEFEKEYKAILKHVEEYVIKTK
jgi:hypothetical protein